MKIFHLSIAILVILLCCCQSKHHKHLLQGTWKVEKVEIKKGPELKLLIDTGCQYWDIKEISGINIFEKRQLQTRLCIKTGKHSIKSFDPVTGYPQDEFMIEKLDARKLELWSRKTVDNTDYQVIYYFDKVRDFNVNQFLD